MNARFRIQEVDVYAGKRVRDLREERGLTLRELAAAIGVTMAQCAKYEVGRNRMSAARLHQIATVLGVEPADLFPPLQAGPRESLAHAEFMEIAKTLSPDSLRFLNGRVLDLLAEESSQ